MKITRNRVLEKRVKEDLWDLAFVGYQRQKC